MVQARKIFLYYLHISLSKYEPGHEISNNVVCANSKGSDQPAHTGSLIRAFACRLNILWLLSYWQFICLKGCTGSSESTPVQMPHCWKSHVAAHIHFLIIKRLTEMVLYTFWMRYFKPPQKNIHSTQKERNQSKSFTRDWSQELMPFKWDWCKELMHFKWDWYYF